MKPAGRALEDLIDALVGAGVCRLPPDEAAKCGALGKRTNRQSCEYLSVFAKQVRGSPTIEYMRLSRMALQVASWLKRYVECETAVEPGGEA